MTYDILSSTAFLENKEHRLTWMKTVAGDVCAFESLGQFMCKEDIAEFAVTVHS